MIDPNIPKPQEPSTQTPGEGPPGLPVLLSASVPDEIARTPEAQGVYELVAAIVRALFDLGVPLVFGGHPTITPLVHRLARERGTPSPPIELFQLERFRNQAPPETSDVAVFPQVHWVGDPAADIATDLVSLRDPMVRLAQAAIFVGGKTIGFSGAKPGIRDEYERFRAQHPDAPVYLVGTAGGETARLIEDAAQDPSGADWEKNGLHGEARHVLHVSHDPSLVAALIARDLGRYRRNPGG
jgi:hypothetical protein